MKRIILTAVLLWGTSAMPSRASDLVVIAHPDLQLQEISADELRAVFLGVKTSLRDAGEVRPVLTTATPELTEFAAEYLGKTAIALRTYYRSLVFTGKWSTPVSLDSDAEVVRYVARTRGAIGFVHGSSVADSVRTVKVK